MESFKFDRCVVRLTFDVWSQAQEVVTKHAESHQRAYRWGDVINISQRHIVFTITGDVNVKKTTQLKLKIARYLLQFYESDVCTE